MKYTQRQRVCVATAQKAMQYIFVVLIVVFTSSCSMHSTRTSAPPTPSEVQAASIMAIHCINLAIPQLDDGISSAEIVGHSAVLSCSQSVDAAVDAEIRAKLPDRTDDLDLQDQIKQTFYSVATSMVLKQRAAALK